MNETLSKTVTSFPRLQLKCEHRINCFRVSINSSEEYQLSQEIIKVREWIPHNYRLLTKVIPLKLFSDMVPSSSADITRAMHGQAQRLSQNYLRGNGRNVIVYVLILFHSREVFCPLNRLFVQPGFHLFCARLAVCYLADSLLIIML